MSVAIDFWHLWLSIFKMLATYRMMLSVLRGLSLALFLNLSLKINAYSYPSSLVHYRFCGVLIDGLARTYIGGMIKSARQQFGGPSGIASNEIFMTFSHNGNDGAECRRYTYA
jgi:hypothetical protein